MKAREFTVEGVDRNASDLKTNHPEVYNFLAKILGRMALERQSKVDSYNSLHEHHVVVSIQPAAGFFNTATALKAEGFEIKKTYKDWRGDVSTYLNGTLDNEIQWTVTHTGKPGNLIETWRFILPRTDNIATEGRWEDGTDSEYEDDYMDEDEPAAVIKGELPPKSYWSHTGK